MYAVPSLIYGKGVGRSTKGGSGIVVWWSEGVGLRALWLCGGTTKDVFVGGGPLVEGAAWSSTRGGHVDGMLIALAFAGCCEG